MAASAAELENRIVYVNGEYVAARDARISISTVAFSSATAFTK
ncbi:D-amino acid aminotransferase [Brucella melitensis]|nr:D-amino acid aminotransferase [Brucella melitensis]